MGHQAFFIPPTAPSNILAGSNGLKVSPTNGALYVMSSEGLFKQNLVAGDFVNLGFGSGLFGRIDIGPAGRLISIYNNTSSIVELFENGTYNVMYSTGFWKDICVAPNGDIYGCADNPFGAIGIIYCPGGVGAWTGLDTSSGWSSIAASVAGDIYASKGTGIYKQTGGVGAFSLWLTVPFTICQIEISSINDLYIFNSALPNTYLKATNIIGTPTEQIAPQAGHWMSAEQRIDGTFYLCGAYECVIRCLVPGSTFSTIYFSASEGNIWPFDTQARAATNPSALIDAYSRRGTVIDDTDTIYVIDEVLEDVGATPDFDIKAATLKGIHENQTDTLSFGNGKLSGHGTIEDLIIGNGSGRIDANTISNCAIFKTSSDMNIDNILDSQITTTTGAIRSQDIIGCRIRISGLGNIEVGGILRGCNITTEKRNDEFIYLSGASEMSGNKITMDDLTPGGECNIVYCYLDSTMSISTKIFNNLIVANTDEDSVIKFYAGAYYYDIDFECIIENNTFVIKDGFYFEAYGDRTLNLRNSNNIIYGPRTPIFVDIWPDDPLDVVNLSHLCNTCLGDVVYYAINGEVIDPDETEDFPVDPLFLGTGDDLYQLQPGSPCRHTGHRYDS